MRRPFLICLLLIVSFAAPSVARSSVQIGDSFVVLPPYELGVLCSPGQWGIVSRMTSCQDNPLAHGGVLNSVGTDLPAPQNISYSSGFAFTFNGRPGLARIDVPIATVGGYAYIYVLDRVNDKLIFANFDYYLGTYIIWLNLTHSETYEFGVSLACDSSSSITKSCDAHLTVPFVEYGFWF